MKYLVQLHQFCGCILFGLIESFKLDVIWRFSIIDEGTFYGVEVVCTNGDKTSLTTDVLVELILQVDETIIPILNLTE